MNDLARRLRAVSTTEIETMYNLTREAASRIDVLEKLHLQTSENAQMHYSMSAKWAQRARAFRQALETIRDEAFSGYAYDIAVAALKADDAAPQPGDGDGAINAGSGNGADRKSDLPPPAVAAPDLLAVIRHNESVDGNGDPVGAKPETSWETGYAAGIRCLYRFLKAHAETVTEWSRWKHETQFLTITARDLEWVKAIHDACSNVSPSDPQGKPIDQADIKRCVDAHVRIRLQFLSV